MEDQKGSITVYMNILKKVCNDRLDPKVVLGMQDVHCIYSSMYHVWLIVIMLTVGIRTYEISF